MMVGGRQRRTAAISSPSHRKIDPSDVDSISSIPDEIIQYILSFVDTKTAIRTSVLSKRWRHVWSLIPCLTFDCHFLKADSINQTLDLYKAPKMTDFKLCAVLKDNLPYLDTWIEFATSRKVKNLSLNINICGRNEYTIPEFLYSSSCVEQLKINLGIFDMMVPSRSVAWTALKKLSLGSCKLSDESLGKVLAGCPILEGLKLYVCDSLVDLNLTESLHLRTLEIYQGSIESIVAPHLHCINFTNSYRTCFLVDVSSVTEARLDFHLWELKTLRQSQNLQDMVILLLHGLVHVEKLTLGRTVLEILSLAELRDYPFPVFMVKDLTLETVVSPYVIPGLVRVIQNSPGLKKITVHTMESPTISENEKDRKLAYMSAFNRLHLYSDVEVFMNISRQNLQSRHVALFMKLMIEATQIEKMVVRLEGYLEERKFEELLEMLPTLPQQNNLSIVLMR